MKKITAFFLTGILLLTCTIGLFGCAGSTEYYQGAAKPLDESKTFYNIREVYESKRMTRQDLLYIAYYANLGKADNEYPANFRLPTTPLLNPDELGEDLSKKIENSFKDSDLVKKRIEAFKTFAEENSLDYDYDDLKDYYILRYYGRYGDFIAVCMEPHGVGYYAEMSRYIYNIDGITFSEQTPCSFTVLYKVG